MENSDDRLAHTAQDVSQGEIVLKSRRQRFIFIAGLVAAVFFAFVLVVLSQL